MPCTLCNDTGWKLVETGAGKSAVTRCDCWRETLVDKLLIEARIPRRYQHCSLDRFETYENASLQNALKESRALAQAFPVVRKGLFFLGQPGVGKTHLAVALMKHVVQKNRTHGLFYDLSELLRVIRGTYNPTVGTSESDVLRPVMEAEFLILDDLGREKTSQWVEETLNLIVNTRYNERRLTIFTSNYDNLDLADPDSLPVRVGARMYSRLHEMCEFVYLDGADYRELPVNGGVDELKTLWHQRKRHRQALPARSKSQARARVSLGSSPELKWSGGKAGT